MLRADTAKTLHKEAITKALEDHRVASSFSRHTNNTAKELALQKALKLMRIENAELKNENEKLRNESEEMKKSMRTEREPSHVELTKVLTDLQLVLTTKEEEIQGLTIENKKLKRWFCDAVCENCQRFSSRRAGRQAGR